VTKSLKSISERLQYLSESIRTYQTKTELLKADILVEEQIVESPHSPKDSLSVINEDL